VNAGLSKRLETLPIPPSGVLRGLFLFILLGLELVGLTIRFDAQGLAVATPWWAVGLSYTPIYLHMGLAGVAAFLVIVSPRFPTIWQGMFQPSRSHRWGLWLALHVVAFGVFTLLTAALLDGESASIGLSVLLPVSWTLSGATALLLWLCAIAPPSFWWHLAQHEYAGLLGASLAGVGAWASGQITREFWQPLAAATLWLARHLLGLWYTDIHYQLPTKLLGTAMFQVTIAPECSGYEGVGLVLLLLTLYLWLFRTHLRFPQAVLLLPLGALGAWVANVLRITTLIALGTSWSPAVAQGGFHSQAGWIAFLLVGLGLIAVTQRYHVFTVASPSPSATVHTQYATALVVPLLVMMATMVVTSAVSSGVDWLYPLRVITTGMALWAFRKAYHLSPWRWSWHAPVYGMTVFGIWMCLEPAASHSTTVLANGLTQLPPGLAVVWLGWRVLGSVLTVPLAEELAFRGYVIHKLVARDFETVPPGQFTWWACLVSSVLFGVLHGRWLAGTLAGTGYALALRHRGHLADAVVAHMTTNALIAAYVLHQHAWALWF